MAPPHNKRRIHVLNPAFQYGLAARLAGMVLFIMTIAMMAFYLLAQNILSLTLLKYEVTVEDPANLVLLHSFPSVIVYLAMVAIFTGLLCLLVIRYTHRVWGPIYRFEQTARELRAGNLNLRVQLREGDSCELLAAELNGLIAVYTDRLTAMHEETEAALAAAQTPALASSAEGQRLQGHLLALQEQLSFFRTGEKSR